MDNREGRKVFLFPRSCKYNHILPQRRRDAEEIQADEELSDRIELSGLVKAVDAEARTITMAADSNGTIAADMVLEAPKRLDLEPLTVDRTYNVSAGIEEDGTFTITGLSPDYIRKAADDSAAAFGDQR